MTDRAYTLKELQELQNVFLKHDTSPANALGTKVPHGLQADGHPFAGLFSSPGGEPDVFSAVTRPESVASLLLKGKMSVITNPQFDILTGVQAGRGSNSSGICDNAPKAGFAKLCTHTAQWGVLRMDTDVGEIPTLGSYLNRADLDKRFVNLQASSNPFLPEALRSETNLNDFTTMQLFTMGVHIERVAETVLFQGNKALAPASTQLGFIREFDGFDQLIAKDYVDAYTNQACTAAYSLVNDWGGADVSGSVTRNLRTWNIVQVLTEMIFVLKRRAEEQGLSPVTWALVMHPDLFRAVTREWACNYLTSGCKQTAPGSGAFIVNADNTRDMMDEMFNGKFLWVEGERFPVVLSRGMANTQTGSGFKSTIYIIPFTAKGVQVTYLEGFDQGNPQAVAWASGLVPSAENYKVTNGGLYAFTSSMTKFCKQYHVVGQMRLIMRTPWLAGRLDNVAYTNFEYTNDPYPNGIYHFDGGVTQRYAPTLFSN